MHFGDALTTVTATDSKKESEKFDIYIYHLIHKPSSIFLKSAPVVASRSLFKYKSIRDDIERKKRGGR